ncbi:hypothetical protein ACFQ2B_03980 [Streptomyces stramineus]
MRGQPAWLERGLLLPAAREAWGRGEPVQMLTGHLFDAVQIPTGTVGLLARPAQQEQARSTFRDRGIHAAVIADPLGWYYALVPPRTAEGWDGDAPCFGPAHSITVPPPPAQHHRALTGCCPPRTTSGCCATRTPCGN